MTALSRASIETAYLALQVQGYNMHRHLQTLQTNSPTAKRTRAQLTLLRSAERELGLALGFVDQGDDI